jgi:N,N'-diacetyllegionaminate synthase
MAPFNLNGRPVGPGAPCYVIAEAGVNHNGDVGLGKKLIDAAKAAGADAVKFQTFRADRLASELAPKADYQRRTTDAAESQRDMLRRLELDEAAHQVLLAHCRVRGIEFLSTPFEEASADLLARLGVPGFKLPSGELTNLPFLAHVARQGKPMLVSTGMASLEEVRAAVDCIRQHGNPPLVLLQCVSNYPAEPRDVNLRAMETMASAFGVPVGYSDHTDGSEVALAAVALGACVIEKHLTLDRNLPGPDHKASSEPAEFAALVRGIRRVESALGTGRKEPAASEADTAAVARKSIVASRALRAGVVLGPDDLAVQRPGTGIPPRAMSQVIGRTLRVDVPAGGLIQLSDLK